MKFAQITKNKLCNLLSALIVVAVFFYAQNSYSQESDTPISQTTNIDFTSNPDKLIAGRFEVGEELVFSLNIQRYKLGDIFVLVNEEGLMFDFMAYTDTLRFSVEENARLRMYKGWFIERNNAFSLDVSDLNAPEMTLKGIKYQLDPKQVFYSDDVLYVSDNYLKEWFELTHEYKFNLLEIELTSSTPIPFQQALARRGKKVNQRGNNEAIHPELFRGYELLSPQTFDFSLQTNYRDINQSISAGYGLVAARDVALVHANLFLSGTDTDLLSNSRINLSKVSTNSDLLGFLNASKVEFGDVRPVRQGFSRNQSRGLSVTNATQTNNLDIQFTNISGLLQVGWDVELYRNGTLIGQEFSVETGEFEFLDVPLNFGENNFEIIKYGPEGQITKEYQHQTIDKSFLRNTGVVYAVSLTESGESVFNTQNEAELFDAGYNFSSDIRTTIIPNLLLGFGFQTDFAGDFAQSQYTVTANTILADKYALSGFFNINDANRQTANVGVRTSLGGQSISASYSLSSSDSESAGRLKSHTALLRNTGSLSLLENLRLTYNNEIRYDDNVNFTNTSISNSIGYSKAGFGVFNRLEYLNQEFSLEPTSNVDEIRGAITIQKGFGPIFNRLTASYGVTGNEGFQSLQLASSWNISKQHRLKFDVDYNYLTKNTISSLLFGWRHERFNLYARAGYSNISSWDLGMNATFSLSAQPLVYGDTYTSEKNIAETGSLSVRVFLDENLNAKIDPGESVIPGVKVELKQALARAVTNSKGIATLAGIADQKLTDVAIDIDTLPNPYLKPLIDGVSIRFRKGIADKLDFPVSMTSEMEGMVFIDKNKNLEPAVRAKVNLLDSKGSVVSSTSVEYDGYFVFAEVFAGNYQIEVAKDYLTRKQLVNHKPVEVEISANSDLIGIDDIILTEKKKFNGYLALIKAFDSNARFNFYMKLNRELFSDFDLPLNRVPQQGQYLLAVGYYPTQAAAEKQCLDVLARGLPCESIQYEYVVE